MMTTRQIRFCWLLLLFVLNWTLTGAVHAEPPRPLRALLITGGCCHDYDRQKLILTRGLNARVNIEWTVVHQGGTTTDTKIPVYADDNWAEGFDIVVHNECFAGVKDPAWVDRILKPHREGTPAILIHCAMHCYRTGDDRWFEFCGMQSPGHGPHFAYLVENLQPDHPIMKDFGASWMTPKGELYHSVRVFETATPLAHARRQSDNQPQVCVWTNQYHQGRVFATTIGHHNETMAEPQYLDMLARGLLWAVNRENLTEIRKTDEQTDLEIIKLVNAPLETAEQELSLEPCCGMGNLAFGRPAKASSEETNKKNFAANAVDGNLKTRWCASGPRVDEWWQVDLGQPETLGSLRVHWEGDAVYRYRIAGSLDGESWTTLVDMSENKTKGRIRGHRIETSESRYLRLTYLGCETGGWASIWEFEAHAGDLPELPQKVLSGATPVTAKDVTAPAEFETRLFGIPPLVNYPVCLSAAPTGEVFVGVDEMGSLGKEPGRGRILRCLDLDGDGQAERINEFARVDHPRGLIYDQGRLWVLNPPRLTLFIDEDLDGVADREEVLIEGISTDQVGQRGADHTTNGIRMGIDGWIYIAVGDYGVLEARGRDDRVLNRRGGGVIRVRPDGTEMEFFAWGLRNILDVCIDPFLNMFTRDNTNDGGGWDVRLSQILQGAEYGYPSWYRNFADEIMPVLADYGGGSGCGGMHLHDARWPAPFGDALYTCDWGRSEVYRHPLEPVGPTFAAGQEVFVKIPRPTDIDVDGRGLMYISSWKDGKFAYDGPDVGFVAQIRPRDFLPKPFPNLRELTAEQLIELFRSPSAVHRLHASRELLRRDGQASTSGPLLLNFAGERLHPLAARVAALFCYKQLLGQEANPGLLKLATEPAIREFALRAATDRATQLDNVPAEPFVEALADANPRVQAQALISLSRLGHAESAAAILPLTHRSSVPDSATDEQAHKKPLPELVLPHLAVRALVQLNAWQLCLDQLNGPHRAGALWTLRYLHRPEVIAGLQSQLQRETDETRQQDLLAVLCRLYFQEGEYRDGWWGTRPDHTGPYFASVEWSHSAEIARFLRRYHETASPEQKQAIQLQLTRHKIRLPGVNEENPAGAEAMADLKPIVIPPVDPGNKNQIANLPYPETLARAMQPGDAGAVSRGQALFQSQSCHACHTTASGQTPKGPHLVDIGRRYRREELIESILKPSAKIAQGFDTYVFVMDDGKQHVGFVTGESAETIAIRKNDGLPLELPQNQIEFRRKQEPSMMPEGLVNNLTPQQLADLLEYLNSLRSDAGN